MAVVACLGAATALFAATIGLAQRDIKKVLAYSTISQLGYMFIGVGTGAFAAGIFHLTTHAFFKACLFLGAGSVIHALSGEQDIFRMGGLRKKMPVTAATFLLSTLAISGIPPLAGFFSKDEILTSALLSETRFPLLYQGIFAVGLAGAFLTAFYMMRLYWLAFQGSSRLSAPSAEHAHESPAVMTLPLVVLAGLAVVGGGLGLPGDGNLFHRWMAPVLGAYTSKVAEASAAVHWGLVAASVAAGAVGLAIAWLVYRSGPEGVAARLAAAVRPVHTLLVNKYWVDELYDLLFVRPLVALSWFLHRVVDVVFIDLLGVNLPAFAVKGAGVIPRFYHDGNVQRYLFAVVAGVAVLWAVL
jgi:NADH-quinone oxidoreductase subunit L